MLAEKYFETIDIYEQRDRVGGIWNLSPTDRSRRIPIPQTNSRYGSIDANGDTSFEKENDDNLEFESPLYDYLETNIPKQLMRYSDTPFPEHYPLFPSHQEVLEYLERYADEVRSLIKFNTQVKDVRLVNTDVDEQAAQGKWRVIYKQANSKDPQTAYYDAVIVANGHYTVPYVPNIDGIAEWNSAYPGTIIHSKAYRKPEKFKNRNVLVIGNSASGIDIAAQIGKYSNKLYLSGRSESIFGQVKVDWRDDIDEVIEFLPADKYDRGVRTRQGKIIEGLDSVLFATGYFYSFPFMQSLDPPVVTDGMRTIGMYQHFLSIDHPDLALPLLNLKVIPFGLAENQAAVIARIWSGRLPSPSVEEMRAWEKDLVQQKGDGKHFHLKKFPEDGAQMNELYIWAASAQSRDGLANNGKGKLGMVWDHERVWMRSKFPDIKAAYAKHGDERREVRNLEDLGFVYEDWRRQASDDDLEVFQKAKCP